VLSVKITKLIGFSPFATYFSIFGLLITQVFLIRPEYPDEKPLLKAKEGKEFIFCSLRKRWFILTPEEWVRQNFLLYLIHKKKFPPSLMAAERQIRVGEMMKRFDLLVFDQNGAPFMIVECKEMNTPLSDSVIQQAMTYNISAGAPFLAVTNGNYCAVFEYCDSAFIPCKGLPEYV
jgi:hypothetical protein